MLLTSSPSITQPDARAGSPWAERIRQLEEGFRTIAVTRMAVVPVLNPQLAVQAVGFEPDGGADATIALGVLITPWFMNLMRLPLRPHAPGLLEMGRNGGREIGGQRFDFIGADEPLVGRYELCSLYSPMFEFTDQEAAVATAREVLALLRRPPNNNEAERPTSRRSFLFGRSATGGER